MGEIQHLILKYDFNVYVTLALVQTYNITLWKLLTSLDAYLFLSVETGPPLFLLPLFSSMPLTCQVDKK